MTVTIVEDPPENDAKSSSRRAPMALLRLANTTAAVRSILQRSDLTEEEMVAYLSGGELPPCLPAEAIDPVTQMRAKFRQRRSEIRALADQLPTGQSRIDPDGRLVPQEPPRPPRANLEPPPIRRDHPAPHGVGHVRAVHNPLDALDEDLRPQEPPLHHPDDPQVLLHRLQNPAGLLRDPQPPEEVEADHLTFRRICVAVFAVVVAFVCVILQTLPLLQSSTAVDPTLDQLLHEVLQVRFLKDHLRLCPNQGLDRSEKLEEKEEVERQQTMNNDKQPSWLLENAINSWWSQSLARDMTGSQSCSQGVLHIPAKHVLANSYLHSSPEEAALVAPFQSGIDMIWPLPCHTPSEQTTLESGHNASISKCYPGLEKEKGDTQECRNQQWAWLGGSGRENKQLSSDSCFRGVHDDVISTDEVERIIWMGGILILKGGDHFDIHYDTSRLKTTIPTVLKKLRQLLRQKYHLQGMEPVAFRVSVAGPMDLHGVNLYQDPAFALNNTNYLDWVKHCERKNNVAQFSLPWPFRVPPVRDTCNLMADLEADPRFAVQTSVSLTNGAGVDYRGGTTLYVDNHWSNFESKEHIQRGLSIDGSEGRVLVSTGGIENRRCRMPTRAGLQATLQIWWDCS